MIRLAFNIVVLFALVGGTLWYFARPDSRPSDDGVNGVRKPESASASGEAPVEQNADGALNLGVSKSEPETESKLELSPVPKPSPTPFVELSPEAELELKNYDFRAYLIYKRQLREGSVANKNEAAERVADKVVEYLKTHPEEAGESENQ